MSLTSTFNWTVDLVIYQCGNLLSNFELELEEVKFLKNSFVCNEKYPISVVSFWLNHHHHHQSDDCRFCFYRNRDAKRCFTSSINKTEELWNVPPSSSSSEERLQCPHVPSPHSSLRKKSKRFFTLCRLFVALSSAQLHNPRRKKVVKVNRGSDWAFQEFLLEFLSIAFCNFHENPARIDVSH